MADAVAHCLRQDNLDQLARWFEEEDPDLIAIPHETAVIAYQSLLAHPASSDEPRGGCARFCEWYPVAVARVRQRLQESAQECLQHLL